MLMCKVAVTMPESRRWGEKKKKDLKKFNWSQKKWNAQMSSVTLVLNNLTPTN